MKTQIKNTISRNSKVWKNYRIKISKIESSHFSRSVKEKRKANVLKKTYEKLSENWTSYRIKEFNKDTKQPVKLDREYLIQTGSEQHYIFKGINKPSFDKKFSKYLSKVASLKDVRYIMVILKIYIKELDITTLISEMYSPLAIKDRAELNKNLYTELLNDLITKKARENRELNYDLSKGYEILDIFLRVIYEKSYKSKTKVTRKYRVKSNENTKNAK